MTSFPDPDRNGGYIFRAVNSNGKIVEFGVSPGGSPVGFVRLPPGSTGFVVFNNQGTPILTVPPSGFTPPPPAPPTPQIATVSGLITSAVVNVVPPDANDIALTLPPASQTPGLSIIVGYRDNGTGAFCEVFPNGADLIVNNSPASPNSIVISDNRFYMFTTMGTDFWFASNNL